MADRAHRTVLAIDTATDTVVTGVARLDPGDPASPVDVLAERSVADGRRHAEILTTLIAETLTEAGVRRDEIDAVVVGTGPGPFTGLRVGMATGAGFADALDIPAFGVCSLDAIAVDARRVGDVAPDATVLVATDARRREVYWNVYGPGAPGAEGAAQEHAAAAGAGPRVAAPAAVAAELGALRIDVVGGSAVHLRQIGWDGDDPAVTVPSVAGLVGAARPVLAADDGTVPPPLMPLYLRRPDAVERRDQRATAVIR
ncbi:tRNA (adenosine(37)-N6)-threonylcarbamoyltransferase complex dimerization subunit type 1 TsaB [Gordonia sinesedis]